MFALLRLLPVSDRDKEVEILARRHQIMVLERQLGKARPRFFLADRAFLDALLDRLPRDVLGRFRLLVRPETVLRWHRDLLARRHAARSRLRRPGRATHRPLRPRADGAPGTGESVRWGYRVQMPRMNSIMERWAQTCRRELLDRTLIWNQRHLLQALREFEQFYDSHRPHQEIANVRPLRALPSPIPEPTAVGRPHVHRRDRLGGIFHEYRHAA